MRSTAQNSKILPLELRRGVTKIIFCAVLLGDLEWRAGWDMQHV